MLKSMSTVISEEEEPIRPTVTERLLSTVPESKKHNFTLQMMLRLLSSKAPIRKNFETYVNPVKLVFIG